MAAAAALWAAQRTPDAPIRSALRTAKRLQLCLTLLIAEPTTRR
jgi:hypothetical protein